MLRLDCLPLALVTTLRGTRRLGSTRTHGTLYHRYKQIKCEFEEIKADRHRQHAKGLKRHPVMPVRIDIIPASPRREQRPTA